MELWTWQGHGFDLHQGIIVPSRGEYADPLPAYLPAVEEIAQHLGTSQFIWASPKCHPHRGRIGYLLNTPNSAILAVLDGFTWNLRIGNRSIDAPGALKALWNQHADMLYPQSRACQRRYVEKRVEGWRERPLPSDWWKHAQEIGTTSEDPQFLLRYPIPASWILETRQE